ncbi:hypothetical protein GGR56DRAFT_676982 [Xylariaceae sp. FL0804]|nr:hypothetical protein GGR56DRAFT_676982 [Xylariaceae sp. FL0804]
MAVTGGELPVLCRKDFIIGLPVGLCTLSCLCVAFRLYTRLRTLRTPGWDDVFVFVYSITAIGSLASVIHLANNGLGSTHPSFNLEFVKAFYASYVSYTLGTWFIKISLLFQFLRMFDGGKTRVACLVMLGVVTVWGLGFAVTSVFPCWPPSVLWTPGASRASCWGIEGDKWASSKTFLSQATTNAFLDLVVLALPFPRFLRRETTGKGRIGLLALFVLGALANSFATWRLSALLQAWPTNARFYHPTCASTSIIVLTGVIEHNIASVVASIPVFWPELTRRLDRIFVTREIDITVTDRFQPPPREVTAVDDYNGGGGGGGGGSSSQSDLENGKTCRHFKLDSLGSLGSMSSSGKRSRADSQVRLNTAISDNYYSTGSMSSSKRSRAGSQVRPSTGVSDNHYSDDYIVDMVDPLRERPSYAVTSNIQSDAKKKTFSGWV